MEKNPHPYLENITLVKPPPNLHKIHRKTFRTQLSEIY